MANATNYTVRYEYYLGYLDLPPVDASKLKANRYSIVIAFWIGLVSFVIFLFFILFYMSRSGTSMNLDLPGNKFDEPQNTEEYLLNTVDLSDSYNFPTISCKFGRTGGSKKIFPWNYSETIHQNLVTNDIVQTSVDNQGEETEGLCSNNNLTCHHMNNSI